MLYLHGFASGPTSHKAQRFRSRLESRGVALEIPALDEGDFEALTLTKQRALVARLLEKTPRPHVIIGSSLGGYLAALHASEHPVDALVLMAPAVDFQRRLRERHGDAALEEWRRCGWTEVDHYAPPRRVRLASTFLEDLEEHEPWPRIAVPALVFQGLRDDVVPAALVRRWVADNPSATLVELDDGHDLTASIERIIDASTRFLASVPAVATRWPKLV